MGKNLILVGLAGALLSGTGLAADLPRRNAPPLTFTPIPAFAWTGSYIGINTGYAYTERDTLRTAGIGALQANVVNDLRRPSIRLPQDGFSAGGQIGYNYQFTPGSGLVLGIETDAQYLDLQRSRTDTILRPAFNPNVLTNTYRSDVDFLVTVRGRFGYAFDRVLVYGTGGFAYGNVVQNVSFRTGAPITYAGSRSAIETGYAYGAGVEFTLPTDSFLNVFRSDAVTLKGEYLRYDLGRRTLLVGTTGGPGVGYNVTYQTEGAIARGGLNFKFGLY